MLSLIDQKIEKELTELELNWMKCDVVDGCNSIYSSLSSDEELLLIEPSTSEEEDEQLSSSSASDDEYDRFNSSWMVAG